MGDMISEENSHSHNDVSLCRAELFGSTGIVICLVNYVGCRYQLSFDEKHICVHPRKNEIVLKAEQKNKK